MIKLATCICENKDIDQLCSNCTADKCFCLCFMDSAASLLRTIISIFQPSSVTVTVQASLGPGLKP